MVLLLQICSFLLWKRFHEVSLTKENKADIIEAFNSTSKYPGNLLNIDNIYFDQMMDHIYLIELLLNKANSSDNEAPFLFECMYI